MRGSHEGFLSLFGHRGETGMIPGPQDQRKWHLSERPSAMLDAEGKHLGVPAHLHSKREVDMSFSSPHNLKNTREPRSARHKMSNRCTVSPSYPGHADQKRGDHTQGPLLDQ